MGNVSCNNFFIATEQLSFCENNTFDFNKLMKKKMRADIQA